MSPAVKLAARIVDYLCARDEEDSALRIARLEDALRLLLRARTEDERMRAGMNALRVLKGR